MIAEECERISIAYVASGISVCRIDVTPLDDPVRYITDV